MAFRLPMRLMREAEKIIQVRPHKEQVIRFLATALARNTARRFIDADNRVSWELACKGPAAVPYPAAGIKDKWATGRSNKRRRRIKRRLCMFAHGLEEGAFEMPFDRFLQVWMYTILIGENFF